MNNDLYIEEALAIAKKEALKSSGLYETAVIKLIVVDAKEYEIGWFFYFDNFYPFKSISERGVENNDLKITLSPIFVDKFNGEASQIETKPNNESFISETDVVNSYISSKYPDYWINKQKKLEEKQKIEDDFNESLEIFIKESKKN
jgi:hypothetical protein